MNEQPVDPATAKQDSAEFDEALDHAIDLVAVLQAALAAADPDNQRTRFEVVSALVATMATFTASMEDEPFEYALAAIRSADLIVLGLRHAAIFKGEQKRTKDEQRVRAVLKEAFWRARAATMQ